MQTSTNLKRTLFDSLKHMGDTHCQVGQVEKAVEYYQQALNIAEQNSDQEAEVLALTQLGRAYNLLQQDSRAVEFYQQVLRLTSETDDCTLELEALMALTRMAVESGSMESASQHAGRAADCARQIGDLVRERQALEALANACHELGDGEKALDVEQQALNAAADLQDQASMMRLLTTLQQTCMQLGLNDQARTYYDQAVLLTDQIPAGDAGSAEELASAYLERGEFQAAIDLYQQAADKAARAGASEARLLAMLGSGHEAAGQYAEAQDAYERAVGALMRTANANQECAIVVGQGLCALSLGDWGAAKKFYTRANELAKQMAAQEETWLGSAQKIRTRLSHLFEFVVAYRNIEILGYGFKDSYVEAHWFEEIGNICSRRGYAHAAVAAYHHAVDISTRIGDKYAQATQSILLALSLAALGDRDAAEALARQGRAIFVQLRKADEIAWCDENMAKLIH